MTKLLEITPESKEQKLQFVETVKQQILSGKTDIKSSYAKLDFIKKTIEEIMKDSDVKDALHEDLSMYPEKTLQIGNFEITKVTKATYDYSNDPIHVELKTQIKDREGMLKNIKGNIFDTDTGMELKPPLKKQTDYVTIKIIK